jgi:hypothetical protein
LNIICKLFGHKCKLPNSDNVNNGYSYCVRCGKSGKYFGWKELLKMRWVDNGKKI